jgi:ribosomal protein L40E
MSTPAQPDPGAAPAAATCVLCNAPLSAGATRCRACGMYQQLGARQPNPFTRASLWALAGLLAAVYVVVLVIVSLAR